MAKVEIEVPDAEILAAKDAEVQRLTKRVDRQNAQITNLKRELSEREKTMQDANDFAEAVVDLVLEHFPDEVYARTGY